MKRPSLSAFVRDCAKAFAWGLCVAAAGFVLLTALGFCFGGFSLAAGLDIARRGLLIVGAVLLFVSAAALIAQDKSANLAEDARWKKQFDTVGLFGVVFFCAVGVLTVACVLDGILFRL